jgi:beta-lactamase regulating signal transducer with metallopeptidase domain
MSSFNVASGAIDAVVAVAVYAAIVTGVRWSIHHVRNTEANPANNKWVLLTILGLAAAAFISAGSSAGTNTPAADACPSIVSSASSITNQISSATPGMKRIYALQASHLIMDHQSCFDASTIAVAETAIGQQ